MSSNHPSLKVTKSKYNLPILKRKLIAEGILRYFSNEGAFEEKLKVCRQAGIGIYVYNIYLHCFETNTRAFYCSFHFGHGVEFDPCLLFLDSGKLSNQ